MEKSTSVQHSVVERFLNFYGISFILRLLKNSKIKEVRLVWGSSCYVSHYFLSRSTDQSSWHKTFQVSLRRTRRYKNNLWTLTCRLKIT